MIFYEIFNYDDETKDGGKPPFEGVGVAVGWEWGVVARGPQTRMGN